MWAKRLIAGSQNRAWLGCRCWSSAADASPKVVETEIDAKGIAHVQLSRPNKLNGLDLGMFEAIAAEATALRSDRSLRAVILSGKGKAFCAGLDVNSVVRNSPRKSMQRLLDGPSGYGKDGKSIGNLAQDAAFLWRELPVPVITVLHGVCFGGTMRAHEWCRQSVAFAQLTQRNAHFSLYYR
mmetsp:Transcript_6919/g.15842  ORF Transcript_6919/g.15842 Transcript_6919/m.15842 type:complete len:182 (+) Transcript_6919:137-682(+)